MESHLRGLRKEQRGTIFLNCKAPHPWCSWTRIGLLYATWVPFWADSQRPLQKGQADYDSWRLLVALASVGRGPQQHDH